MRRAAARGPDRSPARSADLDELFRIYANLTTVLDLRRPPAGGGRGRPTRGSRTPARAGLEAVYGNFLRGNVADSLFLPRPLAGGARARATRARAGARSGVVFLNSRRQPRHRRDRDRPPASGRRGCSGRRSSSSRRSANRSYAGPDYRRGGLVRAVARRPRRRPARRSSAAGRASARPRTGSSSRGWPRRSLEVDAAVRRCRRRERRELAALAAARERTAEVAAAGRGRRRASGARPTGAVRAGWPRPAWPRPVPIQRGSTAATTRRPGTPWRAPGVASATATTWPGRAGARPRRCSPRRTPAGPAVGAGPLQRRHDRVELGAVPLLGARELAGGP